MKILIAFVCLLITVSAFPREDIYGGRNAEDGEIPYIVTITFTAIWTNRKCSGSILSETKVLSAGNCAYVRYAEAKYADSYYTVHAGLTNLERLDYEQPIRVSSWIIHPDYSGNIRGEGPNDIMIFTLSQPLVFNDRVAPIALPEVFNEQPTGRVVLSGWGKIFGGETPKDLQRVDLEIEPLSICRANLEALIGPSPLDPSEDGSNICTSGGLRAEEPLSICAGDLGSPLVDYKSGKPVLVGVASWGITPCGTPTAPSVYTKVSRFLDWIAENM